MAQLLDANVPQPVVGYLQTNAVRVRKRVTGPLGYWHHFFRLRTCLNAQEEIYSLAVSLVQQLTKLNKSIAPYFSRPAPCAQRQQAGFKPPCPEGNRFCGVTLWKNKINDYPQREI